MRRIVEFLSLDEVSIELFSSKKIGIGLFIFEMNSIELCRCEEISIELFSFLGD